MTKQQCAQKVWAVANRLRGSIKADNYKDYILGLIFYKYLSGTQAAFMEQEGITAEDLKDETTLDYITDHLGYAIEARNLFSDWKDRSRGLKLTAKELSGAFDAFYTRVDPNHKHVFDHIFDVTRAGMAKMGGSAGAQDSAVRDLVDVIDSVGAGEGGYDVLGYIYEYLIYKFSTAAKDDGAFYTPHEVSELIAKLVCRHVKALGKTSLKAYDPTSGSGGLLMSVGAEAGKHVDPDRIKYYGQEKIEPTYHLTRMNLVMKGVPAQNIVVRCGDTLEDDWPYFDDHTAYTPLRVDAVVSNPPYSLNWRPEGKENDARFRKYGMAPAGKADYAFLLHCLYHLEDDGIMGIVLPHGVLFRGDSEGAIRKNLVEGRNIETIIGLPANLFFATGIPTIIMILKKYRDSDDILFIDASKGFVKDKKQNVLRAMDIKKILDAAEARQDVPGFAHLATLDEIRGHEYNLNIPRYVDSSEKSGAPDLAGLMLGQVPEQEANAYRACWDAMPGLKGLFFNPGAEGYLVARDVDRNAVWNHGSVLAFQDLVSRRASELRKKLRDILIRDDYSGMDLGACRVGLQEDCERAAMAAVDGLGMLDPYEAYQAMATAWNGIEGDLEKLCRSGLDAWRQVEPRMVMKKVNKIDTEIQDGWEGSVIPFDLVGRKYFQADYKAATSLQSDAAALTAEVQEAFEELDEDVRAQCGGDKPKAGDIRKHIKSGTADDPDGLKALADKMDESKLYAKRAKDCRERIDAEIRAKLEGLSDDEVRDLLLEKWAGPVCDGIVAMADRKLCELEAAMGDLKSKYGRTMAMIDHDIEDTGKELDGLLSQLTGSDMDRQAVAGLRVLLNGGRC